MKKVLFVVLILVVAAISSASTIGIMKYLETRGAGGDVIILSDKRCKDCKTNRLEAALKKNFPEAKFEVVDYGDRKGKKIYEAEKLGKLPAVLIPKGMEKNEAFKKISRFTKLGKNYYALKSGGKFDPKAEICDNKVDDNKDGLIDCKDPTCKSNWKCMEKKEKPEVDVFVMSHCPFGTQIEKGVLPVWEALGDKANINIRFVDYAMHGKKEVDEQLKQYCIQKMDLAKFKKYLKCFLKDGKADNTCAKEAGIDDGKLATCIKEADKEFGISKNFADKSKWKGRFPPFGVHSDLAKKYGVRGSPTLVVNEVVVKAGRSPKAIMDAVCKGFKVKPEECKKKMDSSSPSPGFGAGKGKKRRGGGGGNAKCGG